LRPRGVLWARTLNQRDGAPERDAVARADHLRQSVEIEGLSLGLHGDGGRGKCSEVQD